MTEEPGTDDSVEMYFTKSDSYSVNSSKVERVFRRNGFKPSSVETTEGENYTRVKVETDLGHKTSIWSRRLELSELSFLRTEFETTDTFFLTLSSKTEVDGSTVTFKTSEDQDDKYVIREFSSPVTYGVTTDALLKLVGSLISLVLIPLALSRLYARRVFDSRVSDEDKTHRIRRSIAAFMVILPFLAVILTFETGLMPIAKFGVTSFAPGIMESVNTALGVILAVVIIPILASMASVVVGILPYDKEIRNTSVSKRSAVKKFVIGLSFVLIPVMVWFFVIANFSDLLSSLPAMIISFGVFILGVMALSPYLALVLQDTHDFDDHDLRERLHGFCETQGYSVRGIKLIEGKKQKTANALVAGTVPGFSYVFLTDYLVEEFDEAEMESVLAHEIGHLKKRHLWIKGIAGFVFFAVWITLTMKTDVMSSLEETYGFYGSFLPNFGVITLYILFVQGILSQRLEYAADEYAADVTGTETTVSALEKLAEANTQKKKTGKLYNLLSLHPSIDERVENLR